MVGPISSVFSFVRKFWSSESKDYDGEEEEEEINESESDTDTDSLDVDGIVEHYVKKNDEQTGQQKVEVRSVIGQPGDMICQHRTGCVTKLYCDSGIIDDKYHFNLSGCTVDGLEEGCRVSYTAYRHSEHEEWRVRHIYDILEEDWGEESKELGPVPVPEAEAVLRESRALQRNIVGQVIARNGREVVVEDSYQRGREQVTRTTRFSLDKVSSQFTPYVGDLVSLSAWVEEDENVCDLSGEVLNVEAVKPLRFRNQNTKVKSWDEKSGTLLGLDTEQETFFDREACDKGYVPCVGDEVFTHSIESVHGSVVKFGKAVQLMWRAVWVKPTTLSNGEVSVEQLPSLSPLSIDPKLEENKRGVVVSGNTDFGVLNVGEERETYLEVSNTSQRRHIIHRCIFPTRRADSQLELKFPPPNARLELNPGDKIRFRMVCTGRLYGHRSELFVILFAGFRVGRLFTCEVTNAHLQGVLTNNACEGKRVHFNREEATKSQYRSVYNKGLVVPGVRPVKPPAFVPVKMSGFPVPPQIWRAMLGDGDGLKCTMLDVQNELEKLFPCFGKQLNPANYGDHFHTLLYISEADASIEMRQYDMQRASFTKAGPGGEFLALQVPGLAEKRPSLMAGDQVKASNTWQANASEFQGFVHKVFHHEVWLKFDPAFHLSYNGEDYKVSFELGRGVWRRSHQALSLTLTHLGTSWLFPTAVNAHHPQIHLEESYHDRTVTALPLPEEVSSPSEDVVNHSNRETVGENDSLNSNLKGSDLDLSRSGLVSVEQGDCEPQQPSSSSEFHKSVPNLSNNTRLASLLAAVEKAAVMDAGSKLSSPTENAAESNVLSSGTSAEENSKPNVQLSSASGVRKPAIASPSTMSNCSDAQQSLRQRVAEAKATLSKPVGTVIKGNTRTCKLNWISNLNSRQRDAVRNILKGEARPLPYIIFGPPGTGKTMTLVEAILQIYMLLPDSRLLVGTPSNSSADLMAERLLDSGRLKPGDMTRLVAYSIVESGRVPEKLIPFCATTDISSMASDSDTTELNGVKACSIRTLGRHRITVGTCVALGQLYSMGFPRGHFTHVIVDEAGQATEPEVLIPLAFLDRNSGQSILAGDPLQLGPVVQSRLATKLGLGESLLSRFLRRFPYQRDPHGFPQSGGYDPRLVTRLCINYRSLPQILDLPSSLFYDSELEPSVSDADGIEATLLSRITETLNLPHCAVIFHGVRGVNLQEGDCPSWFNPHEVFQVTKYVTSLYDLGVTPDDIGIITPYRKQVTKLRQMLEQLNLPLPKVGSVEEFQGQERMIVIVSTVRSSNVHLKMDIKHALGFVVSPRRLNVAISRARALLLVVGNPYLLAYDPYWRSVLSYCCNLKAYVGCDLPTQVAKNAGMLDCDNTVGTGEN